MTSLFLNIATACLLDEADRLLVVRKRGTQMFMLPGGKAERGETPMETVLRELHEELGLTLDADHLRHLGHFQAQAANEPDHEVRAEVFVGRLSQAVGIRAEIEESCWIELGSDDCATIAPLLAEKIMPALRRHLIATTR